MKRTAVAFGLALVATACGKKVPDEVQPTLDSIREDARKVADAAAKTCGAQFDSGQFSVSGKSCTVNVLAGQDVVPTIPSPAKGTSLESNVDVVEVETTCSAPIAGSDGQSCGMSLAALRNAVKPGDFQSGNWDTSEDTCKSSPSNCEMVEVPSRVVKETKSVDLTIVRPMIGGPPGGTATVKITIAKK